METENISEYLNTEEAARIVGKSPGTLANDRAARRGLPYIKLGKKVLYCIEDIRRYMENHTIFPEE